MILRRTYLLIGLAALVLIVIGLGLFGAVRWMQQREEQARTLEFRVPPGTAARIAAGETPEILPAVITLQIGVADILVIANDDSEPVTIGPYRIAPGQRFIQRYYSPGQFDLVCSLHADQQLQIIVEPAPSSR
jgi:hypothetical protein